MRRGTGHALARIVAINYSQRKLRGSLAMYVRSNGLSVKEVEPTGYIDWQTIASSVQHPYFNGTKTNTIVNYGTLRLVDYELIGEYEFDSVIDLNSISTRRFISNITATPYVSSDMIDGRVNPIDEWVSIDGDVANDYSAKVFVSTSHDGYAWSQWSQLVAGDLTCRFAKFKAVLESGNPQHNISVSELSATVMIPT